MKKKLLAILCASALVLALAIPALALETEFEATITIPDEAGTVSVQVPAEDGSIYINLDGAPYDLANATVGDYSVVGDTVTDAFFSTPGLLVNTSQTALDVKVAITATPAGNVKLASTASAGELALDGDLTIAPATANGTKVTVDWTSASAKTIDIEASASDKDGGKLPEAKENSSGDLVNGLLAYRLSGSVDKAADYNAETGWAEGTGQDGLTVKIVFTLTPAT